MPPTVGALDARQQALLLGEYSNMLSCVRCGACLTSCPTYVLSGHEAEGPRGRIAMMRALAEGRLSLTPDLVEHERNCLVCDACTAVCPAGIHMDPMQVALRSAIEDLPPARRPPWLRALRHVVFRRVFADMDTFRLVVRLLWLYQRSGLRWLARNLGILRLLGLHESESFLPRLNGDFLLPRGEVYLSQSSVLGPPSSSWQASLFAGCVMSTAFAETDRATIRVLQRAGFEVHNTAEQGCCGALNAHAGDLEGAKLLARRNIEAFERDGAAPIVVNSAGCGAMLKDYAHHFRDDALWADRARAFSARVKDMTEVLSPADLPMRQQVQAVVTYQEPCHLAHAQRITRQPRALLKAIPGLELREMPESALCCGSAGVYNVTNPRESRLLQQRKLDSAAATGAEVIATANPGCYLQLQSGLAERGSPTRVKHLVELLDEATAP